MHHIEEEMINPEVNELDDDKTIDGSDMRMAKSRLRIFLMVKVNI